jgi:hypothetical protein
MVSIEIFYPLVFGQLTSKTGAVLPCATETIVIMPIFQVTVTYNMSCFSFYFCSPKHIYLLPSPKRPICTLTSRPLF